LNPEARRPEPEAFYNEDMRNADAVQALDRELRALFGARFRSLVVYGSAEAHDGPLSTLALVDTVTADDLRACAERVAGWRQRGLATPLMLEAEEFGRSLDAFPFEFGAILADHEIVSGDNPFAGLSVNPADVRRACEVQARSHLLHLREGFIETGSQASAVSELIVRSAAPLAVLLKHVERLTVSAADEPALRRVSELAPGGTLSADEAQRLFPAYLAALERLVDALDQWSAA
jgi:hypothetical protein